MTAAAVPVCWLFDWPLPDPPSVTTCSAVAASPVAPELIASLSPPGGDLRERLRAWQHDRCAICWRPGRLVEDHDHESGLTRGYLCGSCNVGEGANRGRVFSLYRWRHPTSILGLAIPYIEFLTGRPAEPQLRRRPIDRWADNALTGIGL